MQKFDSNDLKIQGKLKKCPSCGAFFTCQGQTDCWCESFEINKKESLLLLEKYSDCICKNCLEQYSDK